MYTPLNPTFIEKKKTGVCKGIPNFLNFDPKHAMWIITMYLLSENIFKKSNISNEIIFFGFLQKKNLYILHGQVFLMIELDNNLRIGG